MPGDSRRAAIAILLLVVALASLIAQTGAAGIRDPTIITVPGTYLLERNLTVPGGAPAIEVRVSNVTIDGNGWTIAGRSAPNSCGILVHAPAGRVSNVTVRNINIRDLQFGCYFWNTENTSVEESLIRACTFGITFNPTRRGCVTSCRLEENEYGMAISGGSAISTVLSNRIVDCDRTGIYLYRTRGGVIADNYLENARNVYVDDQASGINWTVDERPDRSVACGPVVGGNFWGRPGGRGFSQTAADADSDGICDRTYRVSGYMVDTLPLREKANLTAPVAGFSSAPPSGTAPLTVRFNDTSRGDVGIWEWSFGDGTHSAGRNVTHRYAEPGRYTVTLTVLDPAGGGTATRTGSITVAEPVRQPVAAFRASPRVGDMPLAVQFTDTSTGSPRSWRWTFGDGTSSTERNPLHVYHEAGSYTIGLRVSNAAGTSTRTKTRLVTVTHPDEEKDY